MGEWEGVTRPEDYDMLGHFIEEGHKRGMRVHGSLNVFAGGHNYFDRGIIYGEHADWQSQVYTEGRIVPISRIKSNYNGMLNPANPEVREYELAILREFAEKYPDADGIIFDRVRFDNITSDFSQLSKEAFEAYTGEPVADFPGTFCAGRRTPKARGAGRRGRSSANGSNGAPRSSSNSSSRPADSSRRSIPGCSSATTRAPGIRPTTTWA